MKRILLILALAMTLAPFAQADVLDGNDLAVKELKQAFWKKTKMDLPLEEVGSLRTLDDQTEFSQEELRVVIRRLTSAVKKSTDIQALKTFFTLDPLEINIAKRNNLYLQASKLERHQGSGLSLYADITEKQILEGIQKFAPKKLSDKEQIEAMLKLFPKLQNQVDHGVVENGLQLDTLRLEYVVTSEATDKNGEKVTGVLTGKIAPKDGLKVFKMKFTDVEEEKPQPEKNIQVELTPGS